MEERAPASPSPSASKACSISSGVGCLTNFLSWMKPAFFSLMACGFFSKVKVLPSVFIITTWLSNGPNVADCCCIDQVCELVDIQWVKLQHSESITTYLIIFKCSSFDIQSVLFFVILCLLFKLFYQCVGFSSVVGAFQNLILFFQGNGGISKILLGLIVVVLLCSKFSL